MSPIENAQGGFWAETHILESLNNFLRAKYSEIPPGDEVALVSGQTFKPNGGLIFESPVGMAAFSYLEDFGPNKLYARDQRKVHEMLGCKISYKTSPPVFDFKANEKNEEIRLQIWHGFESLPEDLEFPISQQAAIGALSLLPIKLLKRVKTDGLVVIQTDEQGEPVYNSGLFPIGRKSFSEFNWLAPNLSPEILVPTPIISGQVPDSSNFARLNPKYKKNQEMLLRIIDEGSPPVAIFFGLHN